MLQVRAAVELDCMYIYIFPTRNGMLGLSADLYPLPFTSTDVIVWRRRKVDEFRNMAPRFQLLALGRGGKGPISLYRFPSRNNS